MLKEIDEIGAFLVTWTENKTYIDHYYAFDTYDKALKFFNENNTDNISAIHLTQTIKSSDYDGITMEARL